MCLILISLQDHPTYKLIVAANRDEFYNRKTAAANFWEDHPDVLGGRDLEAFGTWLGITRSGKISMLTNYRDPPNIDPFAPSRGQLVSDYLVSDIPSDEYLKMIESNGKPYNGFNLLVGDINELWYYSNYKKGIDKVSSGIHGLSNHLLDTPWPKIIRGKQKLEPVLRQRIIEPEQVMEILYDDERANDELLPDTGLTPERERALSSMFIKTDNYGSRCSTVVLVDYNDNVLFSERVYDLETFQSTTQSFSFRTIIEN